MCGFAGFIDHARTQGPAPMHGLARRMAEVIAHRGPDDAGTWVDAEAGIALGHRRLAVIDTSAAGHQPMVSSCGRYVIAYNGEVYNFADLRPELERAGRRFRGHSDTEVILEGCAVWGVAGLTTRLIGMFAFALWDRKMRALTLVRDRLGIKPLYWGAFGELLLFGSQLKALRVHGGWTPAIDRTALTAYVRHNYVPCPYSIYQGISKVPPGQLITFREGARPEAETYWDLRAIALESRVRDQEIGDDEAADELDVQLRDAVRRRMVADVPLGAFLSGGVDSSTVVACMQAESNRPIRTFSIGFDQAAYDEAPWAKAVAGHLGTDHAELYVEPKHALEVIPRLSGWFDEPFGDLSQIPTFLVSELARRDVTVALSGDGGDELFAGYDRYHWALGLWRRLGRLPHGLRRAAAGALGTLPPAAWKRLSRLMPRSGQASLDGERLLKAVPLLGASDADALYRGLVGFWLEPPDLVLGGGEPEGALWDKGLAADFPDLLDRMQYLDGVTYLPDDILTKLDRASMAVSLEARVPILDHRVVELAWRLPRAMKVRGGEGKWLLRQVLYKYVPRELVERPKAGFVLPVDAWLRGPLRGWAEELLAEERLREDELFRPAPIRAKWKEHLSGARNWQYHLWTVLMFQSWKSGAGL